MITSLIKVGLLSFISAISPLKAVSSNQDHTADSEINVKADIRKAVSNVEYTPLVLNYNDTTYQNYVDSTYNSRNIQLYGDFLLDDTASLGESGYKQYVKINIDFTNMPSIIISFVDSDNNYVLFYNSLSSSDFYNTLYTCFLKGNITKYSSSNSSSSRLNVDDAMTVFNGLFNMSYVSFKFDNQINYNNLFGYGLSDSYFVTPNAGQGLISSVLFYSNGRFFDTINTWYGFADNKTFLVDGRDSNYNYVYYTVPSTPSTAYSYVTQLTYNYDYIDYTNNTVHSTSVVVNKRNTNYYYDESNGSNTQFIDNSSSWINSEYQELRIYIASENDFIAFKSFNNSDFVMNYEYITFNDIPYVSNGGTDLITPTKTTGFWLKDAFNLINLGVSGIIGFLNIKIFPDLTLGAFILVPFAVSLLIIVLKLFKR